MSTKQTHLTRGIVVMATVLVSLLVVPSPASATAFANNGFTGLLFLNGGPAFPPTVPVPMVGPITYGCPNPSVTVDVNPVTGPTASVDITGLFLQSPFVYTAPTFSTTFMAVFTRISSTPGTSGTINPITGIGVSMRMRIYLRATGTLCGLGAPICTFQMDFVFDGTHTAFPTTSGVTHLNLHASPAAITVPVGQSCLPPFSAYPFTGRTAQITFFDFGLV